MATLKNTTVAGTGAITLPVGTTAQRPGTPQAGDMRFNDSFDTVEYYDGSIWRYQPDIVRNGLVLHLDAGEPDSYPGTGTTWSDLSSENNDGSLINTVTYNSSNGGYLSAAAGETDSIQVPNSSSLELGSNDWTYEMYVNANSLSSLENYLIFKDQFEYALWISTTQVRPHFNNGLTGGFNYSTFNYAFSGTTWYSIAVTYLNSSQIFCYINGVLIGGGTPDVSTQTSLTGGQPIRLLIGSVTNSIGALKMYNRALSAAEVDQNFQALRGRYGI